MYLGQSASMFAPVDTTPASGKTGTIPKRSSARSEILAWRSKNFDFPWKDFTKWFMEKYLPTWNIRTPIPAPEDFYNTMSEFLKDMIQFETDLYGVVISDVGTGTGDEYPPLYTPPELPPDYSDYWPPPVVEESEFPWTYVAIGAGALVVALLLLKKRKG